MYKNFKFVKDIMVHHTLQNKDRSRIIGMLKIGQTQTVIARQIGINQSQVSRLIAKNRQTNDVIDRPRPGRPRISSAPDDRVLVDVEWIHFKITSLLKLKCLVADPLWCGAALVMITSFSSRLFIRQTLTGQRYIDDILEPIVYLHFRAHQAARPIFQDKNARPHRARIVTHSLVQEGIENLQWPIRSPDMNPIEHVWDRMGRNVCKRNDVLMLEDLVRAFVDEWNNLEPRFLRKLVQGMPRRVRELHQRRGGNILY